MFIRSERLFLRPAWLEDADDVARLLTGEDGVMSNIAAHGLTGGAPGNSACTREPIRLLITLPSALGSEIIGGIGLTRPCASAPDGLRLGYWLSRRHWGHGYAAEAARGVLAFARAIGHRRVFADQSVDDRASLLALTRAGFRPTGQQRSDGGRIAAVYVAELDDGSGDDCDGADEIRAA